MVSLYTSRPVRAAKVMVQANHPTKDTQVRTAVALR